ncbi:MAG TPA: Ig-like domain-containing protein, partial [Cellvibrio sp.]|nr:Ig-like domain-containing protein [Cellvibrio sp.]
MNVPDKRPCFPTSARRWLSLGGGAVLLAIANSVLADPPTAVSDSRTIPVNSNITLNVLANDFDADGDPIAVVSVDSSSNADITLNPDGSIFYSPNRGFQGADTFTYTIQEETEEAQTAVGT